MKPDLLDEVRLKRIFKPLEAAEPNGGAFARSRGVIFTDAMGFHAVVSDFGDSAAEVQVEGMELACGPLCSLTRGRISRAQHWDVLRGVHKFLLRQCGHTTNPQLLQGLLHREDGLRCCVLGEGYHKNNYTMEAQWSPNNKIGRAFHSLRGALDGEHGSCECEWQSSLHPP